MVGLRLPARRPPAVAAPEVASVQRHHLRVLAALRDCLVLRGGQAVAVLEDHARAAGLECERVAKDPERANLVIRLRGTGDGPSLAFLGHADVVPAHREAWSVEPFAGVERDGAIWGRGAVDMKCQVAATVVALATLARDGFQPAGDLLVVVMADEEVGSAGVGAPFFVQERPDLCPDYVIGEGSAERSPTRGERCTSSTTASRRRRRPP